MLPNSSDTVGCSAFVCLHQDTQSFSIVKKVSAKGRCPFSPFERSAVVIAGQCAELQLSAGLAFSDKVVKPQAVCT